MEAPQTYEEDTVSDFTSGETVFMRSYVSDPAAVIYKTGETLGVIVVNGAPNMLFAGMTFLADSTQSGGAVVR